MSFQIRITNNTGKTYLIFPANNPTEVRGGMRLELRFPPTSDILQVFDQLEKIADTIKEQMAETKGNIETNSSESGQYIEHEVLGDLELKITDSEAEKLVPTTT